MILQLLVIAALLGIVVLVPLLLQMRHRIRGRVRGIGPILIDALIAAQLVLLASFAWIVARAGGWNPSEPVVNACRWGLGIAFAVKPWITYFRLLRWDADRRQPDGRPGDID